LDYGQELPLQLKWPNDIYYARAFTLVGVLVNSMAKGDSFHFTLGASWNVANSKPTVCINDMLDDSRQNKLDVETVIARTLNNFEGTIEKFRRYN
jgi:biotin---protein ligase